VERYLSSPLGWGSSVGSILGSRKLTGRLRLCMMHWKYQFMLCDILGEKTVVIKAPSVFILNMGKELYIAFYCMELAACILT
jgi:hypothetical protein